MDAVKKIFPVATREKDYNHHHLHRQDWVALLLRLL